MPELYAGRNPSSMGLFDEEDGVNIPPEIIGGPEWNDEDIEIAEWIEARKKKEREKLKAYGY